MLELRGSNFKFYLRPYGSLVSGVTPMTSYIGLCSKWPRVLVESHRGNVLQYKGFRYVKNKQRPHLLEMCKNGMLGHNENEPSF